MDNMDNVSNNNDQSPYPSVCEAAMLSVLAAVAVYYYGIRAAAVAVVCVLTCMAADALCLVLRRKHLRLNDLSALSGGLAIAVMLPASIPYTAAAAACLFAVCIAKHPFGGHGHELLSCAAAGYIFCEQSFPQWVLMYPRPFGELSVQNIVSSGLYPSFSKTALTSGMGSYSDFELLIGSFAGPMGCTCALLVTVCALVLISQGGISGAAFFSEMAVIIGCAYLRGGTAEIKITLAGGMTVFAAAFLTAHTELVPRTRAGRYLYGVLAGLITSAVCLISALENPAVYAAVLTAPVSGLIDGMALTRSRKLRAKRIFGGVKDNG